MSIIEVKSLLEYLENELLKYDFDTDKNFIMNERRKGLKKIIEKRLQENDSNINEIVSEAIFNFWEFIGDEYPGNILISCEEMNISIKEFETMNKAYKERGIICKQEKEVILEMINLIKNYINEKVK